MAIKKNQMLEYFKCCNYQGYTNILNTNATRNQITEYL